MSRIGFTSLGSGSHVRHCVARSRYPAQIRLIILPRPPSQLHPVHVSIQTLSLLPATLLLLILIQSPCTSKNPSRQHWHSVWTRPSLVL